MSQSPTVEDLLGTSGRLAPTLGTWAAALEPLILDRLILVTLSAQARHMSAAADPSAGAAASAERFSEGAARAASMLTLALSRLVKTYRDDSDFIATRQQAAAPSARLQQFARLALADGEAQASAPVNGPGAPPEKDERAEFVARIANIRRIFEEAAEKEDRALPSEASEKSQKTGYQFPGRPDGLEIKAYLTAPEYGAPVGPADLAEYQPPRRRGPPRGNANAIKTGYFGAAARAERRARRRMLRECRALAEAVESILPPRASALAPEPSSGPSSPQ